MIYTVTFNPAIDYVVRLNAPLQAGTVNRAAGEDCVLGGKGINVSGVLAQLGCPSVALGFGRYKKLEALQKGDILVVAGSIPASLPADTYERILARLQGHGVRTVVDASGPLLARVLPYGPFLIKPNHHELAELAGCPLPDDDAITRAARQLQSQGAHNVLVSMAGDGALLLDEAGTVHRIGVPQGKVINSVGAGDSMLAGFVAGYLQSGSYAQALRLGTACGSATAFSLGLATREEIERLLEQL